MIWSPRRTPPTRRRSRWLRGWAGGRGVLDIAEDLTRQGIPPPSASDPARNPHRSGLAWSKSAVRTIITDPRCTGRQVWNEQRKDEVLRDVEDVALGYTTKMRWNTRDRWIWSEHQVHDELVSTEDFERAQQLLAVRARGVYSKRPTRTSRPYAFRGCLFCGYCDRRMQGDWNNDQAYYRCRAPRDHIAEMIDHVGGLARQTPWPTRRTRPTSTSGSA